MGAEGCEEVGDGVAVRDAVEGLAGQAAQLRGDGRQVEPVVDLAARPQPADEHEDGGPDERRAAVVRELRLPGVREPGQPLGQSGEKEAARCGRTRGRGGERLA